jgi:hypothetical protein
MMANPDDRVVVNEVLIGSRGRPSIRSVVAQDRRRAPLFLLLSWVLKIVDVRRCE